MSENIPAYFQREFSDTWEASLLEQRSLLETYVTPYPFQGKWKEIDFLDDFETENYTGRMTDVVLTEVTGDKRYILNKKGHPKTTPALDQWDSELLGKHIAPNSELMNRLTYAYNRSKDGLIVDAIKGTAYSGTDGPTTANSLPAGNTIAHGSTGLTFDKVTTIAQYAMENGFDLSEMTWVISARDHKYLLDSVNELRNKDFTKIEPITNGKLFGTTWMGMNWVHGRDVITADTTTAPSHSIFDCVCFAKRAVYMNPGSRKAAIEPRPDKDGAIQFRTSWIYGAVRARDEGAFVVKTYY